MKTQRHPPGLRFASTLAVLGVALMAFTTPDARAQPAVHFGATNLLDRFIPVATNLSLYGPTGYRADYSGACINPLTGELLVVLRGPRVVSNDIYAVHFYTPQGTFLRQVQLLGFTNPDLEGICVVNAESNLYAIVDERTNQITILTIATNAATVSKATGRTLEMGLGPLGNDGIEGITWDAARGCFYAVKEWRPIGIYRVIDQGGTNAVTQPLFDAVEMFGTNYTDLSDLHYDAASDHLILLSDESQLMIECTLDGQVLQTLPVGLVQPEGLAINADRTELHAIGEPNHHLRYALKFQYVPEGSPAVVTVQTTATNAPGVTNSVEYVTLDVSARAGIDYVATRGTLYFSGTNRLATITVPTLVTQTLESPRRFDIHLTNAVNAIIGEDNVARISIVDTGGFAWSPIGDQNMGRPFTATITAVTTNSMLLSGFHGVVDLRLTSDQTSPPYSGLGTSLGATKDLDFVARSLGLRFTPTTTMTVTHLRHYWGDQASLWTDAGVPLAVLNSQISEGIWQEIPLPVPVTLTAGSTYRLAVHCPKFKHYYISPRSLPAAYTHGSVLSGCRTTTTNGFPDQLRPLDDYVVDLRYTTVVRQDIPIDPTVAGPFFNGRWTGSFVVTQRFDHVQFEAQDSSGRLALSTFFDVLNPRLSLEVPPAAMEGVGLVPGAAAVILPSPAPTNLTVTVVSSHPALVAPATPISFAPGETRRTLDVTFGDNALTEGSRAVTLTATASEGPYEPGSAIIHLWDDESAPALFLSIR